ncbi:MAG: hypothetical protein E6772_03615 [Dysgonomonas sp.]|nr:hypothetical protein [Dysgonomonas sp.]
MKNKDQQNALIKEINKRLTKKTKLADILINNLGLSKEAAYRRLRNEVPLTFQETAILAKDFGISLDSLVGVEIQKGQPFQLKFPDFINTRSDDYEMFDDFINFLKKIANSENTELAVLTNIIPQDIFSGFEYLTRYYIFKWQYYCHNEKIIPFGELKIHEKAKESLSAQFTESKKIKNTYYIIDTRLYIRIVDEIKYFHSIQLITDEEMKILKKELIILLNYMEELTIRGVFSETGNKVSIYITNLEITASYSYLKSEEIKYCLIKAFLLTSATSLDNKAFEKMEAWIQASMRTSTLITQANERERLQYFRKQREVLNGLC